MTSETSYHALELEIARSGDDPRRVMPSLPEHFDSILDVGCGAGQTLIACDLKPGTMAYGIDVDEDALGYGRSISSQIQFVRARGEQLPFPDRSFDVVISRIAAPYMNIPVALSEFERVLKPGGLIWLALHRPSVVFRQLGTAIRAANLRSIAYHAYILLNSLAFHWRGVMFRYPLNTSRCESFQTASGIVKAMRRAGFEDINTQSNETLTVTATKAVIFTESQPQSFPRRGTGHVSNSLMLSSSPATSCTGSGRFD